MSIDLENIKNQEFEKSVKKMVEDVDMVYSTVDKKYMTNKTVNYSTYTHTELCEKLDITNAAQRNKMGTLIKKYGKVIDVGLPQMGIQGDL